MGPVPAYFKEPQEKGRKYGSMLNEGAPRRDVCVGFRENEEINLSPRGEEVGLQALKLVVLCGR